MSPQVVADWRTQHVAERIFRLTGLSREGYSAGLATRIND
ncbi:hypothetical protein EC2729250_3021 [Escherichia coli 2729250]|nr:hypothetical protein EC2729250_3021 [Escherichia coli 2729250]ENG75192.1 hypothetical protein ECP03052938_5180 [Escherichia coli p0305293.8]ENH55509.1 hypothetical protein ECP03052937_5313 [Escherichia coli p0305293.7]